MVLVKDNLTLLFLSMFACLRKGFGFYLWICLHFTCYALSYCILYEWDIYVLLDSLFVLLGFTKCISCLNTWSCNMLLGKCISYKHMMLPNMKLSEHYSFFYKDIVSQPSELILSMTEGLKQRTLLLLDKVLSLFIVIRKQVRRVQ